MTTDVALVGAHGYGAQYLDRILAAEARGEMRLIGIADPSPVVDRRVTDGVERCTSLGDLLNRLTPDVTIIATPIPTHEPLATAALRAGSDVLLEKPPAASGEEFARLLDVVEETGRACQVGFQSLGSRALPAAHRMLAAGSIGRVTGFTASAAWARDEYYFRRAPWAGRRRDADGRVIADGALTNPLAHAVATLLALAGAGAGDALRSVDVELYRANDIESDDTSTARLAFADGQSGTIAVTLCAPEQTLPVVSAIGETGRIDFYYSIDVLVEHRDALELPRVTRYDRVDLLDDLVSVRHDGGELLSPLADCAGFMSVLDAVLAAPEPRPIDAAFVTRVGEGVERRRVIPDIEHWLGRSVTAGTGFRGTGAPWAN